MPEPTRTAGLPAGSPPTIPELMDAAEQVAVEAGEITLRAFGKRITPEVKPDGTPVTPSDREAEQHIRAFLEARWPEHGILGEEFGETNPGAPVRWILDPIDGTRSFMHGVPLYGVLIGVEIADEPVAGVAHFPALGETMVAGKGEGCWWNGRAARVSTVDRLEEALVLTTDVERILRSPLAEWWREVAEGAGFARTWGDCYGHILVATGRAELMVDPILSAWDAAPLLTIVTEAGGSFTDLQGNVTIHGGSGVSAGGGFAEVLPRG